MDCMSKDKAEAVVEELKKIPYNGFCPLIGIGCNNDCVCFREASVGHHTRTGTDDFYVRGNGCDNMMFFRECQIQY